MRDLRRWPAVGTALALLVAAVTVLTPNPVGSHETGEDCARRYVAGGDGVVFGTDADDSENNRYSHQLLDEHFRDPTWHGPWCEYNTSKDPTTSDTYREPPAPTQQAIAWDRRPDLISLQVGRQNNVINDHVTKCLQNIKDHDFIEANVCALAVLANQPAFDDLTKDLAAILNTYKVQMSGNPQLIAAIVGYYNPYPAATDVATKIPQFCAELQDTIPTCIIRWILLPPALITLDQVVKKLNKTIEDVVKKFIWSSQGRFVFVNPYEEFKDHCTAMEVEIKTKVYHPTNTVHNHDSKKDFGCSDPWIASDDKDGTKSPFLYLTPAVTGVLILATQTTKKMGINPNEKGHDCISDMIWEATKNKLGIPEKPVDDVCSDVG